MLPKPVAEPTTVDLPAFDLEVLRPKIDAALATYTRFDDGCPPHLAEAIRYSLLAPGKRIRPQLVVMSAEACGAPIDAAMPAACAIEMVHAYSLVHDDLPAMDDDDLRRGQPTCHKVFGEAVAILVGDALLAKAFEVLAAEVQPAERAARCCALLGRAAGPTALVGGQAADLAGELGGGAMYPLDHLEAIHHRKTGALIIAALELGGIVAGASDPQMERLRGYGKQVGLAFQITDDLLDVNGSQAAVGKRLAKDADRGKLTFPQLLGIEESRRRVAALVDEACGIMESFGPAGAPLRALARFVASRSR